MPGRGTVQYHQWVETKRRRVTLDYLYSMDGPTTINNADRWTRRHILRSIAHGAHLLIVVSIKRMRP